MEEGKGKLCKSKRGDEQGARIEVLILVNIQHLEKADGHPEIKSPKFYVRIVLSIVGLCPHKNPNKIWESL